MQIIFGMRGSLDETEPFIRELRSIKFPFKKDGKKYWLPMGVRDWKIMELAFPEGYQDQVIQTLNFQPKVEQKYISKYQILMRKLLKLKKIPPVPKNTKKFMIHNNNQINKIPIGLKFDDYNDKGEELI